MTGPADEPKLDFELPTESHQDHAETHGLRLTFGKHKDQLWTRVPVGYLRHLANNAYGDSQKLATIELKRRGHGFRPDIEITAHAIDRASMKLHMNWQLTKKDADEGIHSWLARIAGEAYAEHGPETLQRETEAPYDLTIDWQHTRMVFSIGHHYPTLKTIMAKEDQRHGTIRINTTANKSQPRSSGAA